MFWWLAVAATLTAQQPEVHYLHQGIMPPGAIGSRQLQRGAPLSGYYQPVEIKAPPGALISMAVDNQFEESQAAPRKVGLLIGAVYRLRVTNIRMEEGVEVFPTIEVIDRIFAPEGQQQRFAIPIDITEEDLKLAASGKFVTRIIYLEDPRNALPVREDPKKQSWFEVKPGQDPLAVADGLGRPVAILRLGGRLPVPGEELEEGFFIGSPPFSVFRQEKAEPARSAKPAMPEPPRPTISAESEPKKLVPKASPFRDESANGNSFQDETPSKNALREEAPKGNVLRDDVAKPKKPEPAPRKEEKPEVQPPKVEEPQEEASEATAQDFDVPKVNEPQEESSKATARQHDVPKVNILPPPPEVSRQ